MAEARAGAEVTLSTRTGRLLTLPKSLFGHDLHDYAALVERLPRALFHFHCQRRPTVLATDLGIKALLHEGKVALRGALACVDGLTATFADGQRQQCDTKQLHQHERP